MELRPHLTFAPPLGLTPPTGGVFLCPNDLRMICDWQGTGLAGVWQGQPGLAGLAGFWQGILEPANPALAGFKTWTQSCGYLLGIVWGIVWGMVRALVGGISVTLFKGILRPISAR